MVVSTHGCWGITAQSPCYTSSAVAVAAVAAAALRKPLFFPSFVPPATLSVCLSVRRCQEGGRLQLRCEWMDVVRTDTHAFSKYLLHF